MSLAAEIDPVAVPLRSGPRALQAASRPEAVPVSVAIAHEEHLVACLLAGDTEFFPDHLEVEHFEGGSHRAIWKAMKALRAAGEPRLTPYVLEELARTGDLAKISWSGYFGREALEQMVIAITLRLGVVHGPEAARKILAGYQERRLAHARTLAAEKIKLGESVAVATAELVRVEQEHETRTAWAWMRVDDIFAPLGDVPWLVEGLGIAPGAPTLIAGYGFSRKTLAVQSMALAVASGVDVWGVFRGRKGRVRHIDHEQGGHLSRERYQRLARAMRLDPRGVPLELSVHPSTYLDSACAESEYMRAADGCALVIVDSLRAAAPSADENSSEIRRHLDLLGRVSERTGACFLVVHHAAKPQEGRSGRYSIRGSSALFDACSTVFVFAAEKGEPTVVAREKDRLRGGDMEGFGLAADDVEQDGDRKWGLLVRHLEPEQLAAAKAARDQRANAAATEKLRTQLVAIGRFEGSKNALLERVGGGDRTVFFSALTTLELSGELVREGSYHHPVFTFRRAQ